MHWNFTFRPEFTVSKLDHWLPANSQTYTILTSIFPDNPWASFPECQWQRDFNLHTNNNLYLNYIKFFLYESNKTYPLESAIKILYLLNLPNNKNNEKNISYPDIFSEKKMYSIFALKRPKLKMLKNIPGWNSIY